MGSILISTNDYAVDMLTDPSGWSAVLSATDTTVQIALNTINAMTPGSIGAEPADSAIMKEGENVSLLNNDADYQSGSEVDSTIATHTSNADAHHAKSHVHDGIDGSGQVAHSDTTGQGASDHHIRYADTEAVTAMGAKGDTNPLNHDRYTDGEADAIADGLIASHAGDADAHHAQAHNTSHITGGADIIPQATATENGLVPLTGVASGKYLKDDMSWSFVTTAFDAIVGRDYVNISNAIAGEGVGAVIGIFPNTYTETANIVPKSGQRFISMANGNDPQAITIVMGNFIISASATFQTFEGIYFSFNQTTDKAGIDIGTSDVTFKNCTFAFAGTVDSRGLRILAGTVERLKLDTVTFACGTNTYRPISADDSLDASEGTLTKATLRNIKITGGKMTSVAGQLSMISLRGSGGNLWENIHINRVGTAGINSGDVFKIHNNGVGAVGVRDTYLNITILGEKISGAGSAISYYNPTANWNKPDLWENIRIVGMVAGAVAQYVSGMTFSNWDMSEQYGNGIWTRYSANHIIMDNCLCRNAGGNSFWLQGTYNTLSNCHSDNPVTDDFRFSGTYLAMTNCVGGGNSYWSGSYSKITNHEGASVYVSGSSISVSTSRISAIYIYTGSKISVVGCSLSSDFHLGSLVSAPSDVTIANCNCDDIFFSANFPGNNVKVLGCGCNTISVAAGWTNVTFDDTLYNSITDAGTKTRHGDKALDGILVDPLVQFDIAGKRYSTVEKAVAWTQANPTLAPFRIKISAGVYLISKSLIMNNASVSFQGAGKNKTILKFDRTNESAINYWVRISGSSSAEIAGRICFAFCGYTDSTTHGIFADATWTDPWSIKDLSIVCKYDGDNVTPSCLIPIYSRQSSVLASNWDIVNVSFKTEGAPINSGSTVYNDLPAIYHNPNSSISNASNRSLSMHVSNCDFIGSKRMTGTMSGVATANALTGVGTLFTTELFVGGYIVLDDWTYKIATIVSNVSATIVGVFSATKSGIVGTAVNPWSDGIYVNSNKVAQDPLLLIENCLFDWVMGQVIFSYVNDLTADVLKIYNSGWNSVARFAGTLNQAAIYTVGNSVFSNIIIQTFGYLSNIATSDIRCVFGTYGGKVKFSKIHTTIGSNVFRYHTTLRSNGSLLRLDDSTFGSGGYFGNVYSIYLEGTQGDRSSFSNSLIDGGTFYCAVTNDSLFFNNIDFQCGIDFGVAVASPKFSNCHFDYTTTLSPNNVQISNCGFETGVNLKLYGDNGRYSNCNFSSITLYSGADGNSFDKNCQYAGTITNGGANNKFDFIYKANAVADANYTILDFDLYTDIDMGISGSADYTATLPSLANNISRKIRISHVDNGSGSAWVTCAGADEFLDGSTSIELPNKGDTLLLIGTTNGWKLF